MIVLVTGGTGFIMANVVAELLRDDQTDVVIVDAAQPDSLLEEFLRPFGDRVSICRGDVRDPDVYDAAFSRHDVTRVVHGATITDLPEWEREIPATLLDVNVRGTVTALEAARQAGVEQFVYVSSGAVYGDPLPTSPDDPQPEEGPLNPPELYAIGKLASEQITRRYRDLFDLDATAIRLSGIYGPLERATRTRAKFSPVYSAVRAYVEGRAVRITSETLDAGGDFLSAVDVGRAVAALLAAGPTAHPVYNVAYGTFTGFHQVLQILQRSMDGFEYEVVSAEAAELAMSPADRRARHNAYAIERITQQSGWQPRPLEEALVDYANWVLADPERRCPAPGEPRTPR